MAKIHSILPSHQPTRAQLVASATLVAPEQYDTIQRKRVFVCRSSAFAADGKTAENPIISQLGAAATYYLTARLPACLPVYVTAYYDIHTALLLPLLVLTLLLLFSTAERTKGCC